MKDLPKEYLSTEDRKNMWKNAKIILSKMDKELDFSEVYAIGSMISKKKTPQDIDFAIVTKCNSYKSNKSNLAYPIDLIILPENKDSQEYLKFFEEWMKKKYGNKHKPIKLK